MTAAAPVAPERIYTRLDAQIVWPLKRLPTDDQKEILYAEPCLRIDWKRWLILSAPHSAKAVQGAIQRAGMQVGPPRREGNDNMPMEAALDLVANSDLRPDLWEQWYKPFQRDAALWGIRVGGGHLWHSAGAGKTATAIAWMLSDGLPGRGCVVVVTKAAVRLHWGREITKLSTCVPWISNPSARQRKTWVSPQEYLAEQRANGKRPVFVIGWEEIDRLAYGNPDDVKGNSANGFLRDLVGADAIQSVVFDEIHLGKSHKRKNWSLTEQGKWSGTSKENRTAAAFWLASCAHRKLGLTATPIPDRVRDLWGQLSLVENEAWGRGANRFFHMFCAARPGEYGGLDTRGASNLGELKRRLQFVRDRVSSAITHAELPPLRRERMILTRADLGRPTKGATGLVKAAQDSKSRVEAELVVAASRKRPILLDQIKEALAAKQKVVIFTGRRYDVDDLKAQLKKSSVRWPNPPQGGWGIWGAHGGHSHEDRDQWRQDYMDHPGGCVLVATIKAMGTGIDLQDTDLAIFAMLPYEPEALEQAEGRFRRHGMKRSCIIRYLIAEGTIDERVSEIILEKLPVVSELVQSDEADDAAKALEGLDDPEEIIQTLVNSIAARVARKKKAKSS